MVMKVYSHIWDEDRQVNAVKIELALHSDYATPDLRGIKAPEEKSSVDLTTPVEQLKNSPELAQTLIKIIKNQKQ